MRYQRLFLGESCLAEDIGEAPDASASFALVCPGCGSRWARLEGTAGGPWGFIRHFCGDCPASVPDIFPGDRIRGLSPSLRIPGSLLATPVTFFPPSSLPGLFLTSPQLARREVLLWGKWMP